MTLINLKLYIIKCHWRAGDSLIVPSDMTLYGNMIKVILF